MRPAIRRRLGIAFVVLACLAVPLLVGWFPQEPLRAPAERLAGGLLGARVSIGELTLTPGLLRLRAARVRAEAPGWEVEAAAIEIALDAGVVFGGQPSLRSVTVVSPRVVLTGPRETEADGAEGTEAVRIESILISNGEIRTTHESGDFVLQALSARGAIGTGDPLEIEGSLLMKSHPEEIHFASTLVVTSDLSIEVRAGRIETSASHLDLSGTLGALDLTSVDLSFETRVGAADLPVGLDVRSAGLEGHGSLRSDSDGFALTAEMDVVDAAGHLDISGSWKNRALEARIGVDSLDPGALLGSEVRSSAPDRLSGLVRLSGPTAGPLDVEVELNAARSESLRYSLRGELDGSIETDEPRVEMAWQVAGAIEDGVPPWVGPVSMEARGTAEGVLPPRIQAELALRTTTSAAVGPLVLELDGMFVNQGAVSSVRAELLSSDGSNAELVVELDGDVIRDLSAHLESVPLASWLPNVRGVAAGTMSLAGPMDAPEGSAQIGLVDLGVAGLELGTASATIELAPQEHSAAVSLPALRIHSKLALAEGGGITGELELRETPLRDVLVALGVPTEDATLSGAFSFALPFAEPLEGSVSGRIDEAMWREGDLHAELTRPLLVELKGDLLSLDDVEVASGTSRLSGSGRVNLVSRDVDASLALDADLADLALEGVAGDVSANVTIRGSLDRPDPVGEVRVANLSTGTSLPWPLRIERATLRFAKERFELEPTDLSLAGGIISLSGRGSLDTDLEGAGDEAHLEIDWRDLELGDLVTMNTDAPAIEGRLSGRAVVDGALRDPKHVRAKISMPALAFSVDQRQFRVDSLAIDMRGGVVSTDAIRIASDAGSVIVSGNVDIAGEALDFTARGDLEPRILSLFVPAISVSGSATTDLRVSGSWEDPLISGQLSLADGAIRLRELPVTIAEVGGSLTLAGNEITLESLTGTIGGGTVVLRGGATLSGMEVGNVDISIEGDAVGLEYPPGLRSRLDLDFSLRGEPGSMLLAGSAGITSASFDLAAAESASTAQTESALLRGIALDLQVATMAPVRVRHDLARLEATGRLDIRGDLERPQPLGRFEVRPGGRLQLSGHEFSIETGNLTYQGSWNPLLSGTASTRLVDNKSGYSHDVSLKVSGSLDRPDVSYSSEPSLSLSALVTLISTGSTEGSVGNPQAIAAGEQAASLLLSDLTRGTSGRLSGFGIDEVTIQPELGLREFRPGARFTFAKRLAPKLRLLYSVSLEGPEARFFELETGPHNGFSGRAQRRDDGSFTLGAGQRIYFGGGSRLGTGREREVRLRSVELQGDLPLPEDVLLAEARIRPGSLLSRWDLEDAAARIQRRLVSEGHIEANVGGRLDEEEGSARLSVSAGPRYTWHVEGMDDPPRLDSAILDSLDELEALGAGRDALLAELWRRGHPFASVTSRRDGDPRLVELTFSVSSGKRVGSLALRFPGARVLSRGALQEACGAPHRAVSDPESCRAGIERAYRDVHHLRATVGETRIISADGAAEVTIPIDEGARAKLTAITVSAADPTLSNLVDVAALSTGSLLESADVEAAAGRIREHFFALGHASVRVVPQLRDSDGDYRLEFEVDPGPVARVESIGISGLARTRQELVLSRLTLAPGDPLDPREIARSERRLLATGLFSRAAITAEGSAARLDVELAERPRYAVGYDLRYNSERGASVLVEAEVGQLIGRGLSIGARGQLAEDLNELRGSLSLPLRVGGALTLQAFELTETFEVELDDGVGEDRRVQREIQLRHSLALGHDLALTYGYRFKRGRFIFAEGFEFEEDVAGLDVALLRDTRDDLLDAREGRSLAANLSLAHSLLGADFQHIKGYVRASFARPMGRHITWAHAYSLGLGTGFGGEPIVSTERFRAGGANSLRGFDEGGAGPRRPSRDDPLGDPTGGEAVVVINQELRYRHDPTGLGIGLFYDVGDVFPTVREMSFDVRHTLGAGVRYRSPVGLLRLDLGWLVDAKEEEPRTRWHFSIGQAF